MIEEIKAKADELGQFYFPDECNVWARDNMEAKFVSSACIEMAEWMQEKMIEKATEYAKARCDLDYCGNVKDVLDYLKSLVEE
jgi:hypothetical protein